jgi:hypothetical protein
MCHNYITGASPFYPLAWSRMPVFFPLLLAAASLASPAEPEPIIGGVPTEPGEFESVVAVYNADNLCSGTLVAPGIVLTAAHCVDQHPLSSIRVAAGQQVSRFAAVPAIAIGVHPQYCRECSPGDDDLFDYGYVVISEDALAVTDLAMPIADQDDWDAAIGEGGAITVVGYGSDEQGVTGVKRKVVTWITSQTATGQEFRAGGDFRDSCNGDSGGPAFVQLPDGRWLQAGVVSRGSEPCGRGGVYGTPYAALPWLQQETGVQLCGAECGACDCLDTAPPESGGCGCSTGSGVQTLWGLLPVLLAFRRARRGSAHVRRSL